MAVILTSGNCDAWLHPDLSDVGAVRAMLVPAAPGVVVLHRVSHAVDNVRNNSPDLVVPVNAVPEHTLF